MRARERERAQNEREKVVFLTLATVQSLEMSTAQYVSPDAASALKAEAESLRNEMRTARDRLGASMGLKARSSPSWNDLVSTADSLTAQAHTHEQENKLLKATMREEINTKSAATPTRASATHTATHTATPTATPAAPPPTSTRTTPSRGRPPVLPPRDHTSVVADNSATAATAVVKGPVVSTTAAALIAR